MDNRKFWMFLNKKGFYMILFLCVITVVGTAAVVTTNNLSKIQKMNESEDLVDLNSEVEDFTMEDLQMVDGSQDTPLTLTDEALQDVGAATAQSTDLLEADPIPTPGNDTKVQTEETVTEEVVVEEIVPEEVVTEEIATEEKKKAESQVESASQEKAEKPSNPPLAKPVSSPKVEEATPVIGYTEGQKMQWPVNGEIVMAFGPDKPIYDKTLEQYRTNSAISIAASSTSQVRAAARGRVESITTIMESPETGTTVVIDHGNGWKTTYGQLQEKVLVKEGQVIEAGQVIGGVGNPSKYAVLLGEHIYFKVTKDGKAVNPGVVLP